MHIGLLQAERHDINIEQKFGTYSEMFQRLFHKVNSEINFTTYNIVEKHYPESLNECDGYLITGSKESVYDDLPWIDTLRKFIIDTARQETKLVGICFGHQLIADALGGIVEKSENGWGVGVYESQVIESNSWMHPVMKQFSLLMSHQDQVIALPDGATNLASNSFCSNAAFRIGRKVLSFQGHPEFTVDYLKDRMLFRKEILGDVVYHEASNTLDKDTQHLEVARWIINFIEGM